MVQLGSRKARAPGNWGVPPRPKMEIHAASDILWAQMHLPRLGISADILPHVSHDVETNKARAQLTICT